MCPHTCALLCVGISLLAIHVDSSSAHHRVHVPGVPGGGLGRVCHTLLLHSPNPGTAGAGKDLHTLQVSVESSCRLFELVKHVCRGVGIEGRRNRGVGWGAGHGPP